LRKKQVAFDEDLEVGVMIEVPSAAVTSDIIAKECAFFSIGTNDLIQYSLAVDRGNEKVAYLYDPLHPGVLRLIRMTIENAHKAGIWVGMCGEMASEPMYAPLLLAMGIDELSASPSSIAKVKYLIRSISVRESRELLDKVMMMSDSKEIAKTIQKFLRTRVEHFDAVLGS
jgi:phosphotransferase system enzyme I (PtsI)